VAVPEVAVVVAVKTTLAPADAGFGLAETTVVVATAGALIVTATAVEALARNVPEDPP
jgi:hypothetical protein